MKKRTIRIAGAGISGLTAAINLAKAGYKVKIFERNDDVGKRFNGDFQGLMNWGFDRDVLEFMKDIGLGINFWNKPIREMEIFGPNNYKHLFRMKRPFSYLIRRGNQKGSFDQYLKEQAIKNRVEIVFNFSVNPEEVDIIAIGPDFNKASYVMAVGYTFETDSKDISAGIFDDKFAYNGYSYLFVADGYGTVGAVIFGKFNRVSEYLEGTIDFFKNHYSLEMNNLKKFTGTGNFYFLKSNKRYVGEAGGFQDYLWGFGMRYAMITGYCAAKSIIEERDYKRLWRNELEDLLKTSVSNRLWYSWLGRLSYNWVLRLLKKFNDPMKVFTWAYRPNVISKILYPFARVYFGEKIRK